MADENQELEDLAEFEAKTPASGSRKDLWLFLIIIDVVLLCVFGFFLYKNLSARLLSAGAEPAAVDEPAAVAVEEIIVSAEPVKEQPAAPVTAQEPAPEEPAAKPEVKPEVKQEAPAAKPAVKENKDKKQSVIVTVNPKSNYRQVTFKYFGNAKTAAVVSGFTMAKPRAMTKKDGVWETTLAIAPGTYKYLYVIDGKQITNPYAETQDGRSVLVVK